MKKIYGYGSYSYDLERVFPQIELYAPESIVNFRYEEGKPHGNTVVLISCFAHADDDDFDFSYERITTGNDWPFFSIK